MSKILTEVADVKGVPVKKGDRVSVIVEVWRDDETPTVKNFYEGKITKIVERTERCFYVEVSGLNRLIPIERVCAV